MVKYKGIQWILFFILILASMEFKLIFIINWLRDFLTLDKIFCRWVSCSGFPELYPAYWIAITLAFNCYYIWLSEEKLALNCYN